MTPNNTWDADQSSAPTTGTPASDLLYHALRLSRVTLGPGRIPSGDQYNDAMLAFNRMIGSWNALRGAIYTVRIDRWPTAGQVQTYTLGPGGDWDGPRPMRITRANLLLPTSPVIRRPLRIWDDSEWSSIRLQDIFTYPYGLYNDGGAPLSTLYFRPIPNQVFEIELYTWQSLPKAVALTDLLAYPDGYEEAIVTNLACRLAPMFQLPVPPDVRILAVNSLAAIARVNAVVPKLRSDADLPARGGLYNWKSGEVEP